MTAPSISTTGAASPLFDAFSSSVSAYSAQQESAPFSSVLQQAQTPPVPAPAPSPPPPAPSPPQPPSSVSTTSSTATNAPASAPPQDPSASANGGQQTAANGTNSDSSPSQAPPATTQPGNPTLPSQSANESYNSAAAGRQTAAPGHTDKSGTRPAASSAAASDQGDSHAAGQATETTIEANMVAAVQPAKKGNQQSGDSQGGSKSTEGKDATSGSSQQGASVLIVDPPAQASVPVVAAKAGEKGHSAGSQTETAATTKNPADVQVLNALLPSASPGQTRPGGGSGKSQSSTSNAASTTNSGSTGAPGSGSLQAAGGFTAALTEAVNEAGLASQTTTATEGVASGSTAPVQAVATLSVDTVRPVTTATGDVAKPTDTPSSPPPSAGAAAASATSAVNGANTPTLNNSATGQSNRATSAVNNPSQNPGAGGPSTVDRARFVQRVARAFQAVGDQGGQIRLRLSPPELGSLDMQISLKDGGITAQIKADNSTAQQLLLDNLPDLRDRLAQQDIHIERFDVQLAGQSSGGMPQSPQGNPDFDQAGRRPVVSGNSPVSATATDTSQPAAGAITLTSGALNVLV